MSQKASGTMRRHILLLAAAAIPLYITHDLHESAAAAALDLQAQLLICQQQAAEIDRFRRQPKFAATEVLSDQELSLLIGNARDAAGIAETSIDLIDPQALTAIGRSPYSRRPVAIDLRALNLRQTAALVDALSDVERGASVSELRLTPLRQQSPGDETELWNVELVLTQLVFCPTSR